MQSRIRAMSPRTKNAIFGAWYALVALLVLFPPLYLEASSASPRVLGLPFSLFYMLLDALLILALVWALWHVERIRGEHEQFEEAPGA